MWVSLLILVKAHVIIGIDINVGSKKRKSVIVIGLLLTMPTTNEKTTIMETKIHRYKLKKGESILTVLVLLRTATSVTDAVMYKINKQYNAISSNLNPISPKEITGNVRIFK